MKLKKAICALISRSNMALLGAFLIHITFGSAYTLSNINSYLISYLRQNGFPNATYDNSVIIHVTFGLGLGLCMIVGGGLVKKFSVRFCCAVGCLCYSLSTMITFYSVKYGIVAVAITYGLLPGLGCGLAYINPITNAFGWFPNKRGLVTGIILAGFGLGSFIFNPIQTAYVNPLNLSPSKESANYFTDPVILDRVPGLFLFLGCFYGVMQLAGCLLLFKPPKTSSESELSSEPNETTITIREALKSREYVVLLITYCVTVHNVVFVNSLLKTTGLIYLKDDMYLAWCLSIGSVANCVCRVIWGLFLDRTSFTLSFFITTTLFGVGCFLFPLKFVLSDKILYLVETVVLFGTLSGWYAIYPVQITNLFGASNTSTLYGFCYVFKAICGTIASTLITSLQARFESRYLPYFYAAVCQLLGITVYFLFSKSKASVDLSKQG